MRQKLVSSISSSLAMHLDACRTALRCGPVCFARDYFNAAPRGRSSCLRCYNLYDYPRFRAFSDIAHRQTRAGNQTSAKKFASDVLPILPRGSTRISNVSEHLFGVSTNLHKEGLQDNSHVQMFGRTSWPIRPLGLPRRRSGYSYNTFMRISLCSQPSVVVLLG